MSGCALLPVVRSAWEAGTAPPLPSKEDAQAALGAVLSGGADGVSLTDTLRTVWAGVAEWTHADAWPAWLALSTSLCDAASLSGCCDVAVLSWLWTGVYQLCSAAVGAYHAHAAGGDGGDGSAPQAAGGGDALTTTSKAAVSCLTAAVACLGPVVEAAAQASQPDPLLLRVASDVLQLDRYVRYNFALKNLVWKTLSQLVCTAGSAVSAWGACEEGAPSFNPCDALDAMLEHMKHSTDALVGGAGAGAGGSVDGKVAARHVKILRFFSGHAAALCSQPAVLLSLSSPAFIGVVLLCVLLRQAAFGAGTVDGDPAAPLAHFVVPPVTDCVLR